MTIMHLLKWRQAQYPRDKRQAIIVIMYDIGEHNDQTNIHIYIHMHSTHCKELEGMQR